MAQLNVRLDEQTREWFDALARARGVSASDLIRSLIDDALGGAATGLGREREYGDPTPRSLTAVERRTLALQHQILSLLTADPDEENGGWEAEHHRRMVEVLEAGYTTEYPDMFVAMQPEMTRRECELVHDIFDMFTVLGANLRQLTPAELESLGEHAEHALTFHGFDFNDRLEGRLASYGRYLISAGRWESMAEHYDDKHERGNSHFPALASYQRMLAVWKPIWKQKVAMHSGPDSFRFTLDALRAVVAAWPYPKS